MAVSRFNELILRLLVAVVVLETMFPGHRVNAAAAASESFAGDGPDQVKIAQTVRLSDPAGGGTLLIKAYYPITDKACPVIVFSHGLGGTRNAFSLLNTRLATWGFVVFVPKHPDSGIFKTVIRGGIWHPLQGENQLIIDALRATRKKLGGKSPVIVRLKQIQEVIKNLGKLQKQLPGFAGTLDQSEIGMAGHSFGAVITGRVTGTIKPWLGRGNRWVISGIKAGEMISGGAALGTTIDPHQPRHFPLLVITGSRDSIGPTGHNPHWREQPFYQTPRGNKYLLFIKGATHSSYSGNPQHLLVFERGQITPQQVRQIGQEVDQVSVAFFMAYLRGDTKARAWLLSGKISSSPIAPATLQHR